MQIVMSPKACIGKDAILEGTVTIEIPNFDQKYQYMEECNFDLGENGEIQTSTKQLGSIRKMVSLSEKHYKAVNVKRKSDGKEFKSFEELSYDADCDSILIEVASQLLSGFRMGKH